MLPMLRRHKSDATSSQPSYPLERLRREFDAVFDDWFGGIARADQGESLRLWGLEVIEGEDVSKVRADIPGFEPNEIDVRVEDNVLTIKAEKEEKKEGEEHYSVYRRTIILPRGVDTERIQANYHNGVLELVVPRSEENKPKRINIQTPDRQLNQPGPSGTQSMERVHANENLQEQSHADEPAAAGTAG